MRILLSCSSNFISFKVHCSLYVLSSS